MHRRNSLAQYFILTTMTVFTSVSAKAQQKDLIVRIARLQIDSTQVEIYKSILKEHAETAVRAKPGVLNLYAVYEKITRRMLPYSKFTRMKRPIKIGSDPVV